MNTKATPDFWDRCRQFFTLRTEASVTAERDRAQHKAAVGAQASGIMSFIEGERKKLTELEQKTDQFLRDVIDHFGQYGVYLKPEMLGKSKLEYINGSQKRRFGIKWSVHEVEEDLRATIAFVITEVDGKGAVRVDYIYTFGTEAKEVLNDDLVHDPWTYKDEDQFAENFRRVRRFENEDAYVAAGLPQWFKDVLDRHVRPLR